MKDLVKSINRPSRRQFVKLLTFGTAVSGVRGLGWQCQLLAEAQPLVSGTVATFKIQLSDYPALQQSFGSVRLGINPVSTSFDPFPIGDFWPIIITRDDKNNFYVLDSECRHASCVVPAFDSANRWMRCNCHGSIYAIDGTVLLGPATDPLRKYTFTFDGSNNLTIQVPAWAFNVTAAPIAAGANGRLSLTFPTFSQVQYEVTCRQRVQDPWTVIPFALTSTGTADQQSITGTEQPMTIYVDRTNAAGIFAVGMILQDTT